MIYLNKNQKLASGSERHVFLYPKCHSYVIKVLKPRAEQNLRNNFRSLSQAFLPLLRRRSINKEWKECIRIKKLAEIYKCGAIPIAMNIRSVETNWGRGVVAERVLSSRGDSPTLKSLAIANNISNQDIEKLNVFADHMFQMNIRASDITASNIVFGAKGSDDKEGAFLVDGFGDIHAIPIRSLSKKMNKISLNKSFVRLAEKVNLKWDGVKFSQSCRF